MAAQTFPLTFSAGIFPLMWMMYVIKSLSYLRSFREYTESFVGEKLPPIYTISSILIYYCKLHFFDLHILLWESNSKSFLIDCSSNVEELLFRNTGIYKRSWIKQKFFHRIDNNYFSNSGYPTVVMRVFLTFVSKGRYTPDLLPLTLNESILDILQPVLILGPLEVWFKTVNPLEKCKCIWEEIHRQLFANILLR